MRGLILLIAAGCWTAATEPPRAATPTPRWVRTPKRELPKGPRPTVAKVERYDDRISEVVMRLPVGTDVGIAPTWSAHILEGETFRRLPGGQLEIVRVDVRATIVRTRLSISRVASHPRVIFTP